MRSCYCYEMLDRRCQFIRLVAMTRHRSQQAAEPAAYVGGRSFRMVGENHRGLMDPRERTGYARPRRCGFIEAAIDELL